MPRIERIDVVVFRYSIQWWIIFFSLDLLNKPKSQSKEEAVEWSEHGSVPFRDFSWTERMIKK